MVGWNEILRRIQKEETQLVSVRNSFMWNVVGERAVKGSW